MFKTAADNLSLSIELNEQGDVWNEKIVADLKEKRKFEISRSQTARLEISRLENSHPESSSNKSSSTSSLSYQKQLLPADYSGISETFSKITKKWALNTDKIVEDVMHEASKEFIVKQYVFSVHSYDTLLVFQ